MVLSWLIARITRELDARRSSSPDPSQPQLESRSGKRRLGLDGSDVGGRQRGAQCRNSGAASASEGATRALRSVARPRRTSR